uniref:Ig-like domain-containing protein n=1 Tax=Lepisosteus oculatus TaxID=7918 RepID=W5N7A5_LEPOC
SITVQQTPMEMLRSPGDEADLHCINPQSSYNYMYWYQQTGDGALKLIGYLSHTQENLEEEFKGNLALSGDAKNNGSLHISSITGAHSAVYFCAVSQHSVSDIYSLDNKWTLRSNLVILYEIQTLFLFHNVHNKVQQIPPALLLNRGETVELNCSHSISNYYTTLWYQQSRGERSLRLIGYVSTTSPTLEDNTDKRFTLSGDGRKDTTLKVASIKAADSAVYFC